MLAVCFKIIFSNRSFIGMSLAALFEVDSIHRVTHDLCARATSATADFELPCKLGGKFSITFLSLTRAATGVELLEGSQHLRECTEKVLIELEGSNCDL